MAYDDRVWVGNTRSLKPLLEKLISAPINILRYVAYHLDEDMRQLYCIHLLELRSGALLPDGVWQPVGKILEDGAMPSVLREGLSRWQEEQRSGSVPEQRAPWACPGWHSKAEHWITSQIAGLGRGAVQNIDPVKSWSISCVLKVSTEIDVLYFKASRELPLFVNEGVFLSRLAELFPNRLPIPVAVAPEWGWMLLDDFGDPLGRDASLEQQVFMVKDFARLQIDACQKIEALLAAGCKDRRIEALASHIEPLFEDDLVLGLLSLEEREKLKEIAPRLRSLISELIALPIPAGLLHGDLHAGNVIMRDHSILYFDWTDAAISHPYFDMIHIFLEEDDIKKTTLQDAYLLAWEEAFPKPVVRRAWELAGTLFGLYHAVSYQSIAHEIEEEVRPELNFAYFFLRKLMEGVKRLDATD